MIDDAIPRPTARVLVLDQDDNLFLILTDGEISGIGLKAVWLPPGGGVEAGESYEEAARRELREEIALADAPLGACVWLRTFPFERDGTRYAKQERYFVSKVEHFEIDDALHVDRENVLGYRWWSVAEIDESSDLFVPRSLGQLLGSILKGELPNEPVTVGI